MEEFEDFDNCFRMRGGVCDGHDIPMHTKRPNENKIMFVRCPGVSCLGLEFWVVMSGVFAGVRSGEGPERKSSVPRRGWRI